jgi:hypothetical protein
MFFSSFFVVTMMETIVWFVEFIEFIGFNSFCLGI